MTFAANGVFLLLWLDWVWASVAGAGRLYCFAACYPPGLKFRMRANVLWFDVSDVH